MDVELVRLGVVGPWPLLLSVGFLAGAMASLFGIGGGILITPFLNILGAPMPLAVATATPVIAANASLATAMNRKVKNLHVRTGLLFAAFMIPSVEFCTTLQARLEASGGPLVDPTLRIVFILAVLATVPAIAKDRENPTPGGGVWGRIRIPPFVTIREDHRLSIWVIALAGAIAGGFAGLLGLGGGRIIVPVLLITAQLGIKRSVGTSSFIILFSSIYAAGSYGMKGMIDPVAVAVLVAGAVPGSLLGVWLLHRVSAFRLRADYLALTAAALTALGLKHAGLDLPALLLLMSASLILVALAVFQSSRPAD